MKKYAVVNLNVAKPNELITKGESNLQRRRVLRRFSALFPNKEAFINLGIS